MIKKASDPNTQSIHSLLFRHPEWIVEALIVNYRFSWEWLSTYDQLPWNWIEIAGNRRALDWSQVDQWEKFSTILFDDEKVHEVFCLNTGLPWSVELLNRFRDKWNWKFLRQNPFILSDFRINKEFSKELKAAALDAGIPAHEAIFLPFAMKEEEDEHFDEMDDLQQMLSDFSYRAQTDNSRMLDVDQDEKGHLIFRPFANPFEYLDDLEEEESELRFLAVLNEEKKSRDFEWKEGDMNLLTDWIDFPRLSSNDVISWTPALIERYELQWDWRLLCRNPAIPWTEDMLWQFRDRIDWDGLTALLDESFFTLDFIKRFENYLTASGLATSQNAGLCIFLPCFANLNTAEDFLKELNRHCSQN
jgi:hypothetical protein